MTRRVNHLSDMQRSILTRARNNDFVLMKPEQMSARLWMTNLAQLAQRDLIIRDGRASIITPKGIAALRCA